MTDLQTSNLDLRTCLQRPLAAADHAVSRWRARRDLAAAAGAALRRPARRRIDSRGHHRRRPDARNRLRLERLVFTVPGRSSAKTSKIFRSASACPAATPAALLDTLRRDRGVADRRLSDLVPVLFAAVAARPGAALHRACRSCLAPGHALQHPLPHRRQSRQRDDAATRRSSQHRRHEGLSAPTARSRSTCCAGDPTTLRVLTGEDAQYHEALTDGADGAILLSAHVETETFAADAQADGSGRARRARDALAIGRRSHAAAVRRAEPGADQVLAVAHRPDRQRRGAVADDGGERRARRRTRSGDRAALWRNVSLHLPAER